MVRLKTALKKKIKEYTFKIHSKTKDLRLYLKQNIKLTQRRIKKSLIQHKNIKFSLNLKIKLKKYDFIREEFLFITPYFDSKIKTLYNSKDIQKDIKKCHDEINNFFEAFVEHGSGWFVDKLLELKFKIISFTPFKGGCINSARLPELYKKKRSIHCRDNTCFFYCVLAALYNIKQHRGRITEYQKYLHNINIQGFDLPFKINQIPRFEHLNHVNINIYQLYKNKPYPVYVSTNKV
jgi:hypothetical protein